MTNKSIQALSVDVQPGTFDGTPRRIVVDVPATCANLGPGFDCLAIALRLRNSFEVTFGGPDTRVSRVEIVGAPAHISQLARKRENLFVAAFRVLCEQQGVTMPPLSVRIRVNLPPGRGLGSSATAVVGGLLAANTMLGNPLNMGELLNLAVTCEPGHHADNVAAALYGGLAVTGVQGADGQLLCVPFPISPELRAVLFIPDMPMSTVRGRSLLPHAYTRADVTFNLGRVALLLAVLQSGQHELLATAMDDRLHQPYREQLFPGLSMFITAARAAGAYGACLSGGGSSVLALASCATAATVCEAMERAACEASIPGHGLVTEVSREGASTTASAASVLAAPEGMEEVVGE